jgi:hypothetical protein
MCPPKTDADDLGFYSAHSIFAGSYYLQNFSERSDVRYTLFTSLWRVGPIPVTTCSCIPLKSRSYSRYNLFNVHVSLWRVGPIPVTSGSRPFEEFPFHFVHLPLKRWSDSRYTLFTSFWREDLIPVTSCSHTLRSRSNSRYNLFMHSFEE